MPEHIAIIMDGNGRWAQQRGLDRLYGHKAGVDTVKRVVEAAGEIGLRYLTLYTFSIENWHRPKEEVDALMGLMADAIVRETPELMRQGVRIKVIGHTTDLPAEVWQKMEGLVEQTAGNRGVTLILALSYGARWEIGPRFAGADKRGMPVEQFLALAVCLYGVLFSRKILA